MFIDKKTDTLYVADSESRDGRTNTGQLALPQSGYGFNTGIRRGIRIGSARTGNVSSSCRIRVRTRIPRHPASPKA